MSVKFSNLVDKIKELDTESKEYLADLIKKFLIEERRRNALNAITLSLRATNGSVAISPHKQEIASSFHSSQ
jgi:phosphopantothenate synthetase